MVYRKPIFGYPILWEFADECLGKYLHVLQLFTEYIFNELDQKSEFFGVLGVRRKSWFSGFEWSIASLYLDLPFSGNLRMSVLTHVVTVHGVFLQRTWSKMRIFLRFGCQEIATILRIWMEYSKPIVACLILWEFADECWDHALNATCSKIGI
jgi:hypothetical protein